MKTLIHLLIITFVAFIGCSPKNQLLLLKNNVECTTTIEGYFSTPKIYKHFAPAVLFKEGYKYNHMLGEVIERNENEVRFVEKKHSFMHTPDTLIFDKSIIRAIIDANYVCSYGDLKENECKDLILRFYLVKVDEPNYRPIFLELESNKRFAYCVKPGNYILKSIVQELYGGDYYYQSFPVFNYSMEVLENKANYIGNIKLVNEENISDKVVSIPFFKQVKERNAGAALGILGGVVASLYNDSWKDEIRGYFHFLIEHSEAFTTESKNQIRICPSNFTIINY